MIHVINFLEFKFSFRSSIFKTFNFLHNQNVLNLEDKFMDYCVHLEG